MERINVPSLKKAGPYSHATIAGGLMFISGQVGLNEQNIDDFESQFDIAIANVEMILKTAGSSIDEICKVTVFISDARFFDAMNKKFQAVFSGREPARTTVVAHLPREDMLVELDVVAALAV